MSDDDLVNLLIPIVGQGEIVDSRLYAKSLLDGLRDAGCVVSLPEVNPATVHPGLYRIYWKSGGSSHAAVGIACNGERWIAATNWVENTSTDWSGVLRVEYLASLVEK